MIIGEVDELDNFLSTLHWVLPNLNDTFGYACADTERIYMDGESNQEMFVKMFREYGLSGIHAYVSKIRDTDVLKELQTPEYWEAKKALEGWTYESD